MNLYQWPRCAFFLFSPNAHLFCSPYDAKSNETILTGCPRLYLHKNACKKKPPDHISGGFDARIYHPVRLDAQRYGRRPRIYVFPKRYSNPVKVFHLFGTAANSDGHLGRLLSFHISAIIILTFHRKGNTRISHLRFSSACTNSHKLFCTAASRPQPIAFPLLQCYNDTILRHPINAQRRAFPSAGKEILCLPE